MAKTNVIENLNNLIESLNDIKSLIKQNAPQRQGNCGGGGGGGQDEDMSEEQERNEMINLLKEIMELINKIKDKAELPENADVKKEVLSKLGNIAPRAQKMYENFTGEVAEGGLYD